MGKGWEFACIQPVSVTGLYEKSWAFPLSVVYIPFLVINHSYGFRHSTGYAAFDFCVLPFP
jgi:hypothetical protein